MTSKIFKVIQDAIIVSIPHDFFKYIYHVGRAINLHSITNSGLIPGGQNLSKRQTVFFLLVDPMDKEHRDPDTSDLEAPYSKERVKLYQTRSNAIILFNTLPAYCIPKAIQMETGEIIYEKVYESPRPPPKISFRIKLDEGIGSRSYSTSRRQPTNPTNP